MSFARAIYRYSTESIIHHCPKEEILLSLPRSVLEDLPIIDYFRYLVVTPPKEFLQFLQKYMQRLFLLGQTSKGIQQMFVFV
jgi:hypothetical protein